MEELWKLRTFVHHLCSATCFPYMANIMSNHSISKINMATFEKETVVSENLCGNISVYLFKKLFWTYFFERTILLFWLEVAFSTYFKSCKQGIQKDFLINGSIIASQRMQAMNYYASVSKYHVLQSYKIWISPWFRTVTSVSNIKLRT